MIQTPYKRDFLKEIHFEPFEKRVQTLKQHLEKAEVADQIMELAKADSDASVFGPDVMLQLISDSTKIMKAKSIEVYLRQIFLPWRLKSVAIPACFEEWSFLCCCTGSSYPYPYA